MILSLISESQNFSDGKTFPKAFSDVASAPWRYVHNCDIPQRSTDTDGTPVGSTNRYEFVSMPIDKRHVCLAC